MAAVPAYKTTSLPVDMTVPAAAAPSHTTGFTWAYLPAFDFLEQSSFDSVLHVFKFAAASLFIGLALAYLAHHRGMRKLIQPAKVLWLAGSCLLVSGAFMAIPREGKFVILMTLAMFAIPALLVVGWLYVWGEPTVEPSDGAAESVPLAERLEGEGEGQKAASEKEALPV